MDSGFLGTQQQMTEWGLKTIYINFLTDLGQESGNPQRALGGSLQPPASLTLWLHRQSLPIFA
jgi:hypothetical protein